MAAVASDGEDRISVLPDDALHHILFFLPSDDAVRTCVLARRWRHLWRSVRSLRVTPRPHRRGRRDWTPSTLRSFVNRFLILREATVPTHEWDILCGEMSGNYLEEREDLSGAYKHELDDDLNRAVCLWIRCAVVAPNSQARVLRVRLQARRRLSLENMPFESKLLTRVELTDAKVFGCMDFSRCPALEDLTMSGCKIYSDKISSTSLAHLTIADSYFYGKTRTRISAPRLVSLRLSVYQGWAPLLEKMPLLVSASVSLDGLCYDTCCEHNVNGCTKRSAPYLEKLSRCCESCYGKNDGSSVLLQGLSEATDLELIGDPSSVFILRKDCNSRLTFSKLRTLLLNEWCLAVDFGSLIYFLQCSPVLEKLTLRLGHCETRRYPVTQRDEGNNPNEQLFFVSKQLKMVEIRCVKKNNMVEKLLLLLMTNGVPSEQIQIEQNFSPPDLSGNESDSDYGDW